MLCAQNAKSNEQNPIIKQLLQLPLFAAGPLARCPDPCAMCTTPPFRDQDGRSTLLPQLRKEQKGGATASTLPCPASFRMLAHILRQKLVLHLCRVFRHTATVETFILTVPWDPTETGKNVVVQLLQNIQGCTGVSCSNLSDNLKFLLDNVISIFDL